MSTAVIFDMDGTLFDTEAVFQKYWNAIAKERGIVLPDAFKYEICGTSGEVMNRIIEKQYRVKGWHGDPAGVQAARGRGAFARRAPEARLPGDPCIASCARHPYGNREQRTAGADREQSVCQRLYILFLCHCERR